MAHEFPPPFARNYERLLKRWTLLFPAYLTMTADAICASVGNAHDFKNGRQFAAWLGLTPRQYSSGGKAKLGRITRRGDAYLRSLLVQGARSTLQVAIKKAPEQLNRVQQWAVQLYGRVG